MARILIVEDDRAILLGLKQNLTFEGHTVLQAIRGDDALTRVREARPDLLILDVMLPGLNGFEVCRRIREADKALPILMLTARTEEVDKVMGLDLGADDYLTKPFSLPELLARVRALLRRHDPGGPSLPDRLAFADVVLDFERYVGTRGGAPVHLTAKEFALVRLLAAYKGSAVRRDVLIERIWGGEAFPSNRTVDTHILSLRAKLEPNPAEPRYLLTVHGVGYRFETGP